MTSRGHVPVRMCAGCRETAPKQQLLRVVRAPGGEIAVDAAGRAPGRGGYVHPAGGCIEAAVVSGGLARALRTGVGADVAGRLREAVEQLQERM